MYMCGCISRKFQKSQKHSYPDLSSLKIASVLWRLWQFDYKSKTQLTNRHRQLAWRLFLVYHLNRNRQISITTHSRIRFPPFGKEAMFHDPRDLIQLNRARCPTTSVYDH